MFCIGIKFGMEIFRVKNVIISIFLNQSDTLVLLFSYDSQNNAVMAILFSQLKRCLQW